MLGGHYGGLPIPIARRERQSKRRDFQRGAHSGHIDEILDRDGRHAEPALALSGHQIERREFGQRLPQRSGTHPVGFLQPPDMHPVARFQYPTQDIGMDAAEGSLGMRGRRRLQREHCGLKTHKRRIENIDIFDNRIFLYRGVMQLFLRKAGSVRFEQGFL